jgi:hypothetical protein
VGKIDRFDDAFVFERMPAFSRYSVPYFTAKYIRLRKKEREERENLV